MEAVDAVGELELADKHYPFARFVALLAVPVEG